ncbi:alpha/beta fold hydrolase [Antarctobacter heliothermus]|uniref:alpha/beta fold hydrolase n=1 Tax=Antarctobacter heliothermus TaxID=74033 RepID=UPI000B790047|nr:hypothetical protein [Antarctobacter heliothermus]
MIDTPAGALEYANADDGPPLMMIHGTGGGFDQGLLFASGLRQSGFRIVAPSRFGYLGSAFPDDASQCTRPMCWSRCSTIWASTACRSPGALTGL